MKQLQELKDALISLKVSMEVLDVVWDEQSEEAFNLLAEKYPFDKSFDELVREVQNWVLHICDNIDHKLEAYVVEKPYKVDFKDSEGKNVSELLVLKSAAGHYIGRLVEEFEDVWHPHSRESEYFSSRNVAEKVLRLEKLAKESEEE